MVILKDFEELNNKHIYLYGAGIIGELVATYLKQTNITVASFVVSDIRNTKSSVMGFKVIPVSDLRNDATVVITTLSDSTEAIDITLCSQGIRKIYSISEELIKTMRESCVPCVREKASVKIRLNEMSMLVKYDGFDAIITDDRTLSVNNGNWINTSDFIHESKEYDTVCVLLIDWSRSWKELINALFRKCRRIALSFRYKFINLDDFSLISIAKQQGYQLVSTKRFFRDRREYQTEDVLFLFEKRSIKLLHNDLLCTGCGLCITVCQRDAIKLCENEHGYYKPHVNANICVDCKKCMVVCPIYEEKSNEKKPNAYAFMADDSMRKSSSSGGAFGVIASEFMENGGHVCGASWKEDYRVEHIIIHNKSDLYKLQRSKYIRSNISNVMIQIKELLNRGEMVLFVGCPCQVAAIKKYTEKYSENLYTIDLICAEAPSHKIMSMYLNENHDMSKVERISFREKQDGWRPDSFTIYFKDGEYEVFHGEDIGQQAFHERMMMDVGCEHCNYTDFPRIGDMTLGDAWGVVDHNPTLNDSKGTSSVFVNSSKGEKLLIMLEKNKKLCAEVPIEWSYKNRVLAQSVMPHPNRDRFYEEIETRGFNKSGYDARLGHYDIGLVGNWSYPNYGSELTYFALYKTLKDMGYSVLMIEWPEDSEWKPYGCTQLFEREPYRNYEIAYPAVTHGDLYKYNDICESFIYGSDQLLNPYLYNCFGRNIKMDWVDTEKKRIGYAFSFGHDSLKYEEEERRELKFYIQNYDAISVREKTAVDMMRDLFDVESKLVLDPVFLCKKSEYYNLIYKKESRSPFVFAYILDPSNAIVDAIRKTCSEVGIEAFIIGDAATHNVEMGRNMGINYGLSIEEWISRIIDCEYSVVDSFHGVCFSILFHKKFIAIANKNRGETRFISILELLGLEERLIKDPSELDKEALLKDIDYETIDNILENRINESLNWLQNALKGEHINKFSDEFIAIRKTIEEIEKKMLEGNA